MGKVLTIALGGSLGALMRYLVTVFSTKLFGADYPWGTVVANLLGAFLIGLLWGFFEKITIHDNVKNFAIIGFLGSFTTFSSLSWDTFNILKNGSTKLALIHLTFTNFLGLALVILGYTLARKVIVLYATN